MCSLSEGIEREGIQKGIQKGFEKQAVLSALQTNSPESVAKFMNIPFWNRFRKLWENTNNCVI